MATPLQSFYIVRFNDCDPLGHLNNARYLDYMLNAREDHLRENYGVTLSSFGRQGVSWVTTRNEIQYLRSAVYNERVCIESALLEVTDSDLLVEIVMYDESRQQLKALLWVTFTHINLKTAKRETHRDDILTFLTDAKTATIDAGVGFKARIGQILAQLKENANAAGIS